MGVFSVSDKSRQKMLTKANEIMVTPQDDLVVAQRKFAMTPGAWVLAAVVGVAMVAAIVVLRAVPFPGVLLIIFFTSMTKPRRSVTFGPAGYTNLEASIWTSRPKEVIATVPTVQFAGERAITIGEETVVMTGREMKRFRSWVQPNRTPSPDAPPFLNSAPGVQDFRRPNSGQQTYPPHSSPPPLGSPQQAPGQPTDLPPPPG